MKYATEIQEAINNPERLEELYQAAKQANDEAEFRGDLQEEYIKSPENLLLSAWKARFERLPLPKSKRTTQWGLAAVVGIITGLILWAISDPQLMFMDILPYFIILWAPITAIPAIFFLTWVSRRNLLNGVIAILGLALASGYVLLITLGKDMYTARDFLILMMIHLPLLCWIGLGIAVMGFRSSHGNRFAFLTKSIEVIIAAGVYLAFGMAFGMITMGMFAALNISLPEEVIRLVMAGGFGLIPIMAVTTMYDPHQTAETQDFSQGLSRFVNTMVRLLLPLTVVVLVIYIFAIPFNFMAPFENRELLIIYNVMQFAIMGLLIGVTPLRLEEINPRLQTWLRRGIVAVIVLALLISLYALSAVVYRTAMDELTQNRTTIIGWNIINIVTLGALLAGQMRKSSLPWNERMQAVFSKATGAYLVWTIVLIVILPLIFR